MKRKIISIDEDACTGCGQCIPDCPEGALQVIEGKARLISDLFCDGLGACIGTCPEGAIRVIEREAESYDERAVMQNIIKQGPAVIAAHLDHLRSHGEHELYHQAIAYLQDQKIQIPDHNTQHGPHHGNRAGCPGAAMHTIPRPHEKKGTQTDAPAESELQQWPVQLRLMHPHASYFDNADLLIAADCVPFAYADFHRDFLKGKILLIFCPKLDADIDKYIDKLAEIFRLHAIHSVTIVHMEVPCCSGVTSVVNQAIHLSEQKIPVEEITITINGNVK